MEHSGVKSLQEYKEEIAVMQKEVAVLNLSQAERLRAIERAFEKKYGFKPNLGTPETPVKSLQDYKDEIKIMQQKVSGLSEPERSTKLAEMLSAKYGFDFKIYEKKAEEIIIEVGKAKPADKERILKEEIEKKHGIKVRDEGFIKKLLKKITPKTKRGKILGVALPTTIALAIFLWMNTESNGNNLPKEAEDGDKFKKELPTTPSTPTDSVTTGKPKQLEPNPVNPDEVEPLFPKRKFDQIVFNMLPPQGQEIYRAFYENDPTPGSYYMFLDKETAILYVFDGENNLVGQTVAGFGQTTGDAPNNAYANGYDKGNMTTPQGTYLFDAINITPENLTAYEGLGMSLQGISVEGNPNEYLAIHQTYPPELTDRSRKLDTPNPRDNAFSNGCINVPQWFYEKFIAPNFEGTFRELFFVLGDRFSRFKTSAKNLIGFQANTLKEKARVEEKELSALIAKNRQNNLKIIEMAEKKIAEMEKNGTPKKEIEKAKVQLKNDKLVLEREDQELKKLKFRAEAAEKYIPHTI